MHRALFVALFLSVRPLSAQVAAHPLAFDVTFGAGTGRGGEYFDREAAHIELTLVPEHQKVFVGALAIGARFNPASGDKCFLDVTRTRCLPRFPSMAHVGILGGAAYGPLRASVGPAVYFGTGAPGFGGQLHVDAAGGFTHVAAVVAARGGLILRKGEALRTGSLELGIRLR